MNTQETKDLTYTWLKEILKLTPKNMKDSIDAVAALKIIANASDVTILSVGAYDEKWQFNIYNNNNVVCPLKIEQYHDEPYRESKGYFITLFESDSKEMKTSIISESELLNLTGLLFKDEINNAIWNQEYEALSELLVDYAEVLDLSTGYDEFDPD